jgi:hypothetical protein
LTGYFGNRLRIRRFVILIYKSNFSANNAFRQIYSCAAYLLCVSIYCQSAVHLVAFTVNHKVWAVVGLMRIS